MEEGREGASAPPAQQPPVWLLLPSPHNNTRISVIGPMAGELMTLTLPPTAGGQFCSRVTGQGGWTRDLHGHTMTSLAPGALKARPEPLLCALPRPHLHQSFPRARGVALSRVDEGTWQQDGGGRQSTCKCWYPSWAAITSQRYLSFLLHRIPSLQVHNPAAL